MQLSRVASGEGRYLLEELAHTTRAPAAAVESILSKEPIRPLKVA
jgi:hypothetical protein